VLRGRVSQVLAHRAAIQGRRGMASGATSVDRPAPGRADRPDRADLADVVKSSQAKMVRLAELLTRGLGRAEDLAQDGYAKAWTRIRAEARRRACRAAPAHRAASVTALSNALTNKGDP
jgi:hypothetical protein